MKTNRRLYVYALFIDENTYDDVTFDSDVDAIYAAMTGQKVAVLDAFSLEYLGYIH